MGGSFGRIQSSAQWGKQIDNFAVYGAMEGLHDGGFRNFSVSNVRRFYGDVGYKNDASEFHVNMAWPTIISVRLRRCRLNCCNNIMARPTPRRKPPPTALAMSI